VRADLAIATCGALAAAFSALLAASSPDSSAATPAASPAASAVAAPSPAASPTAAPVVARSSPAVSPDGKWIAFLANDGGATDVYVVAAEGGAPTRVTATPETEDQPEWAADGRRLVFSVRGGERSRIVSIARDGSDRQVLISETGRTPRLSPDGRSILYSRGSWTEVEVLVVPLGGERYRLTDGKSVAWNCVWSPDGKTVAFTGRDGTGNLQIFLVGADGAAPPRQLTRLSLDDGRAQVPAWSPDGRRIAFQANEEGHVSHLWIADAQTGEAQRVGPRQRSFLDEAPGWFPDGKRLAFQSNRSGRMEIWTVDVDGSDPRQITR